MPDSCLQRMVSGRRVVQGSGELARQERPAQQECGRAQGGLHKRQLASTRRQHPGTPWVSQPCAVQLPYCQHMLPTHLLMYLQKAR